MESRGIGMTAQQLDLFLKDDDEIMLAEIQQTKKNLNTLRRGTFATMAELHKHISNLQKLYEELKDDLNRIESLLIQEKK